MKERKEYIYSALTGIAPDLIDEAAPTGRTRRPVRHMFPIAACLCAALFVGSVTYLSMPKGVCEPAPESDSASADRIKQDYLAGYDKLTVSTPDIGVSSSECLAAVYKSQEQEMTDLQEVIDHFGRDIRPAYLPDGLHTPAELGVKQSWGVYQGAHDPEGKYDTFTVDKAQLYYFKHYTGIDEITPFFNVSQLISEIQFASYVYGNYPPYDLFSPANRGVYITVKSTEAEGFTQIGDGAYLIGNAYILDAENALSDYHGVKILFYSEASNPSIAVEDCGVFEPIGSHNDVQLCEGYDELLETFLSTRKERVITDDPYTDKWSERDYNNWNELLKKNGFKQERQHPYIAEFIADGLHYKLTSNLDFDTFAAIVASMIE